MDTDTITKSVASTDSPNLDTPSKGSDLSREDVLALEAT